MPNRRSCLVAATALGLGATTPMALAQRTLAPPRAAAPRFSKLHLYIPAGTGGGWDQTGRALGNAMQSAGLVGAVTYENKGGKGGTVGLADFTQRHGDDPNCLFVGGLVMLGALAVARSDALKQVSPVARLTSDYLVMCASPDGPIRSFKDLASRLQERVDGVVFTGGSAGGVDHMLAAMLLRSLKLDTDKLRYLPTSSGKDAIAGVQSGAAQVAISGYSEFKGSLENKSLTALAVSSRRALFGVPSLREQGAETELANWRAVFAAKGIGDAQKDALRKLVAATIETPEWRQSLLENNWVGSPLFGHEFESYLQIESGVATVITHLLKLKG
jgi:putative tricarboxylic transport membrane protein